MTTGPTADAENARQSGSRPEPNLHPEPGLYEEDEGITRVEYPVGGRSVDILGIDAEGRLVVIDLKVSRGYDRVVGSSSATWPG